MRLLNCVCIQVTNVLLYHIALAVDNLGRLLPVQNISIVQNIDGEAALYGK